jgi:predicted RNA-binding protein with RPS1 domain
MTKSVKPGEVYEGRIVRFLQFGAFVELVPGKDALVHVSQMSDPPPSRPDEKFQMGDTLRVRVTEIDSQGRVNATARGLDEPFDAANPEPGRPPRGDRGPRPEGGGGFRGGDRGGFSGGREGGGRAASAVVGAVRVVVDSGAAMGGASAPVARAPAATGRPRTNPRQRARRTPRPPRSRRTMTATTCRARASAPSGKRQKNTNEQRPGGASSRPLFVSGSDELTLRHGGLGQGG